MPRVLAGGPTLAVSPDNATIAVLDRGRLTLVDVRQRREIREAQVESIDGGELSWLGDGTRLLTVTRSAEATLLSAYQAPSLDLITRIEMPAFTRALAFVGDHALLIELDGDTKVVTLTTRMLVCEPITLRAVPKVAAGAPEGRFVIEARGQLEFWHPAARRALFRLNLPLPDAPTGIGFAGRGRLLWVTARTRFEVFRFSDGRPQLAIEMAPEILGVEASAANNRVIVALRDGDDAPVRLSQIDLGLREQQELEIEHPLAGFAVVEGDTPLIVAAASGAPLAFLSLSKASGAARGVQLPPPASAEETFSHRAPDTATQAESAVVVATGNVDPGPGRGPRTGTAADRFAAWRARLQNGRTVDAGATAAVPAHAAAVDAATQQATSAAPIAATAIASAEERATAAGAGPGRSPPTAASGGRARDATQSAADSSPGERPAGGRVRAATATTSAYANWRASRAAPPARTAPAPRPSAEPSHIDGARSAPSRSFAARIAESKRDPDAARARVAQEIAQATRDPDAAPAPAPLDRETVPPSAAVDATRAPGAGPSRDDDATRALGAGPSRDDDATRASGAERSSTAVGASEAAREKAGPKRAPAAATAGDLAPDADDDADASVGARATGARWREALVGWGRACLGDPGMADPPPLDDAEPLVLITDRFGLEPPAVRALSLLYASWLCGGGRNGVAAADLARAIHDDDDWSESLGRGELARAGIARARRGCLRLRRVAGAFLDGAPALTPIAMPERPGDRPPEIGVALVDAGDEAGLDLAARLAGELGQPIAAIDLAGARSGTSGDGPAGARTGTSGDGPAGARTGTSGDGLAGARTGTSGGGLAGDTPRIGTYRGRPTADPDGAFGARSAGAHGRRSSLSRRLADGLFEARARGAIALLFGIGDDLLADPTWLRQLGDGAVLIAHHGAPAAGLEHLPRLRSGSVEPAG